MDRHVRVVLRYALGFVCGYELSALMPGARWPTVTHLVHSHRHSVAWRIAVWALLGFLAWHLLVEEPYDYGRSFIQ